MKNNYQTINATMTMYGGRQGNLDGGTWHAEYDFFNSE